MKVLLNALLFWITISHYIACHQAHESNVEEEEANFYESLKRSNNDDLKEVPGNQPRYKRSANLNNEVYESEVKVIGKVGSNGRRTRVKRTSGDDFSISETPIDSNVPDKDPSESNNDASMTEIGTVSDENVPQDTQGILTDPTKETNDQPSDDAFDIGTGIEVESEKKLAEEDDDDDDDDQSSPQSTDNEITLTERSNTLDQILWPSGTYGLPKPLSGCPDSSGFIWETGVRFYDTEDDGTENHNSATLHMAGDVTEDGITLEFCMKTKEAGVKNWPSGKYCIYKKGRMCPDGLRSGFVYWDDENLENKNYYDGILPEGKYTEKTKMAFCCSSSGNVTSEIVLPTDKPFYLFPHGSPSCQKVHKMTSTLEFVIFDEEDKGVIEKTAGGFYPYGIHPKEKDHTFYMCYYKPEDESDLPLESGVANSQKIAHSEKVITEFMKDKETNEEEIVKEEEIPRTRNVKKFPSVQTSIYHAIVMATGFVLTTIAILVGALLVISYFTKRWTKDLKQPRSSPSNENKEPQDLATPEEITSRQEGEQETFSQEHFSQDELVKDEGNEMEFGENEQEEEELVEDQFLPSDSQLKSGLEFLFLKQQNRKWLARHSRKK